MDHGIPLPSSSLNISGSADKQLSLWQNARGIEPGRLSTRQILPTCTRAHTHTHTSYPLPWSLPMKTGLHSSWRSITTPGQQPGCPTAYPPRPESACQHSDPMLCSADGILPSGTAKELVEMRQTSEERQRKGAARQKGQGMGRQLSD